MTKISLLLALLAVSACGESTGGSPAQATPYTAFVPPACAAEPLPPCADGDGFVCPETLGYGFIGGLFDTDEGSSAVLSNPEPGTLCLAGRIAGHEDGGSHRADLIVGVDERGPDGTCIRRVYDARALGATALAFELDRVPDTRVVLQAAVVVQKEECPGSPYECVEGGTYTLYEPDREELDLLDPGLNQAVFSNFVGADHAVPFDASRLSLFLLRILPTRKPIDFDLCVSHIAFLDDAGREVAPPVR